MKDALKAALTVWYLLLTMAFLFLCMVSLAVFFGIAGESENGWWVGLLGIIIFWIASSKYRRKFMERIDASAKNTHKDWDNDGDDT